MAFATICARVNFPAPRGPVRMMAWGRWSRAIICRRRETMGVFPRKLSNPMAAPLAHQTPPHDGQHVLLHRVLGAAGVDDDDALRLASRDGQELTVDAIEEGAVFLLKAVFVHRASGREIAPARALNAVGDVVLEQQGEIGL